MIDIDKLNMIDCKLTIDTLYLIAKLDNEQREFIYDRFIFNRNNPKRFHWRFSQYGTKNIGFSLEALPTNTYTYKHYDHMIKLQNPITTADYIPFSLGEIIDTIDWNIKRIDLAFDFKTNSAQSLIMKHHGNVQFDQDDKWSTKYLGKLKTRSSAKVAFYNRNDKEEERETEIQHEYFNRFEVRLFPKSNDENMKLHNLSDDFIIQHLKKYIIIPDIEALPLNKWDKRKLYKIKDDYTYLKTLDKAKQKELKAITKAHRVPLELIYITNKHNLFRFMESSYSPLQQAL